MKTKLSILSIALISALAAAQTQNLFNGKDLTGWKPIDLEGAGAVKVLPNGIIECAAGDPISGIVYTNTPLRMNYEITFDAMRVEGSDFFASLTIPVETNACTIIIGGWGGGLCGISCVDFIDASENQWSEYKELKNNIWYNLRVRVTPGVLQIFLNDTLYGARVEYLDPKRLTLRWGDIDKTAPLGISTFVSRAWWRNFKLTPINELKPDDKPITEDL